MPKSDRTNRASKANKTKQSKQKPEQKRNVRRPQRGSVFPELRPQRTFLIPQQWPSKQHDTHQGQALAHRDHATIITNIYLCTHNHNADGRYTQKLVKNLAVKKLMMYRRRA